MVRFGTVGVVGVRGEAPLTEEPDVLRSNSGFAAVAVVVVVLTGFLSRGQL